MEGESEPSSSCVTCFSENKNTSDTEDEVPSMRKVIVVKRSTPDEKRILYKRVLGSEGTKFQDPLPFKNKNCDLILKKYSKEKHKVKDYLEESLTKIFEDLPISEFSNVLSCEKSNEILSRLFIVSAYTIENYFGRPGPKSADFNDLYFYTHKLLSLDKNKENENFEIAKSIHPPEFWINLYIVEANGFKLESNFNYVYCKAWINNEPKLIEMTKLVQKTKHLMWNVRFYFAIKHHDTDVINVEMRGSENDILPVDSPLHSLKDKVTKTFSSKQNCEDLNLENCDLLGKVEIRVCDIYSEGVDDWIPLTCTGQESDIFLHVRIKFEVSEPEMRSRGIKRHMLLLRTCVENRLANSNEDEKIFKWETFLDRCALTLIFLHSVISHLTESEDILCRFVVIAYFGIEAECISHEFFYHLLHETLEHLKQFPDDYVESRLQLMYDGEIQKLHYFCLKFISSLHTHNLVENKKMVSEFKFSLKTVYILQNILDSTSAPLMTLKSEAVNWMEKKAEEMMAEIPENRYSYIKQFLGYLLEHQETLDQIINKIFPDETYTLLTYEQFQEIFTKPLKFHISEFCRLFMLSTDEFEHEGTAAEEGIEIFLKVKQLLFYISETVHIPALNLKMAGFRRWFGKPVIKKWFTWRQMKVEKEIALIVISDDLEPVDYCPFMKSLKISVSSRQTYEVIRHYLIELWNLVSFPRSTKFDEFFIKSLHVCCMRYAILSKELVCNRKLMEEFHSKGKKGLCVVLNNIWFLAVNVDKTVLETIGTLPSNLPNSRLNLEDLCREMCSSIVNKYLTGIVRILMESEVTVKEHSFTKYGEYLNTIVWQEVFVDTSFDVFVVFLKLLVTDLLKILNRNFEQYEAVLQESKEQEETARWLQTILNETKEICRISNNPDANILVWDENASDILSNLEKKLL